MHLWICIDTAGHVLSKDQHAGNVDGSHVMELLQEPWIAVFGRIHTLRTDPEGVWCNKEVHDRLSDMQIIIDTHPEETSWQESVTKNSIRIVKDTMTRIALKRPNIQSSEVLAAALLEHNEMGACKRIVNNTVNT